MIEISVVMLAVIITALLEAMWIWKVSYENGILEKSLEQKDQELTRCKMELKVARGWKE